MGHYPKGYTPSAPAEPHTKQILTTQIGSNREHLRGLEGADAGRKARQRLSNSRESPSGVTRINHHRTGSNEASPSETEWAQSRGLMGDPLRTRGKRAGHRCPQGHQAPGGGGRRRDELPLGRGSSEICGCGGARGGGARPGPRPEPGSHRVAARVPARPASSAPKSRTQGAPHSTPAASRRHPQRQRRAGCSPLGEHRSLARSGRGPRPPERTAEHQGTAHSLGHESVCTGWPTRLSGTLECEKTNPCDLSIGDFWSHSHRVSD
ncbi:serine/arginine repetitive matrix protein 3-like [Sturnira hondurensis]|uniref:serine/arginine repetitive matrix protein 3-like n=1 Tax=Sturnira hondurensis TaxID=192404 RepID=UPI00187AD70A|nr:serine/arginine repetitive matrix protein 3-like [Sturnira hondurensis]